MLKRLITLITVTTLLLVLTACGAEEEEQSNILTVKNNSYSYLNGMEEGEVYILHQNGTYEPLIFNAATFEKYNTSGISSTNRIMWFKEDFDEIPTLEQNKNDRLVMFTNNEINEEILLERFKDLGISVGLCQLTPLASGKYSISTIPEDSCSYPDSDADEIINFVNENVIIDKIGGNNLRSIEALEINEEKDIIYDQTQTVNEYGVIEGLVEDAYYDADFYEGTNKTVIKLKADTHILGSCEIIKDLNYSFTNDNILEFNLPNTLPTGYYSLNSCGIFRYINKDDTYSTTTDYNKDINIDEMNEPHEVEEESIYAEPTKDQISIAKEEAEIIKKANDSIQETTPPTLEQDNSKMIKKFNIETQGMYERIVIALDEKAITATGVSATLSGPSGINLNFYKVKTTGSLYLDCFIDEAGEYVLTLHNCQQFNPEITLKEISEEDVRTGDIE